MDKTIQPELEKAALTEPVQKQEVTVEPEPVAAPVMPEEIRPNSNPDRHDVELRQVIEMERLADLPQREEVSPNRPEADGIVEQIAQAEMAQNKPLVEERPVLNLWHEEDEAIFRTTSDESFVTTIERQSDQELPVSTEAASDDLDLEQQAIEEPSFTAEEWAAMSAWLEQTEQTATDSVEQDSDKTPFEAFAAMLVQIAPLPERRPEPGEEPVAEALTDEITGEVITIPENPVIKIITERLQALSPEDRIELTPVFEEIRGIVEYIGQMRSQNLESDPRNDGLEAEEIESPPDLGPETLEALGLKPEELLENLDTPEVEALKERLTVVCRTLLEALDIHDEDMVERFVEALLASAERTVKPAAAEEIGENAGTHEIKHFKRLIRRLDDVDIRPELHRLLGRTTVAAVM